VRFPLQSTNGLYVNFEAALYRDVSDPPIIRWPANLRHPPEAMKPRRWFRFSLRTVLLLVTVFACWLGRERQIVQERHRLWQLINDRGGYTLWSDGTASISSIRALLGDKPRGIIALPKTRFSLEGVARIKAAFPESVVSADSEIWREGDEDES